MRPLCNHKSYCDDDSVEVASSYLSQCNAGGIGSDAQCGGLPYEVILDTVLYSSVNWKADQFLALKGSASHEWVQFNKPQTSYTETLCAAPTLPCDVSTTSGTVECMYKAIGKGFFAYRINFK